LKFNDFFAAPAAPRKLRASHDKNLLLVCSRFPIPRPGRPTHQRPCPAGAPERLCPCVAALWTSRLPRCLDVIRLTLHRGVSLRAMLPAERCSGPLPFAGGEFVRCGRHQSLFWGRDDKKIAAQKLVLSGGHQSSYPYRGVHRGAGGLQLFGSISAGMECMK
jgi:hypothetical protein